MESVWHKVRNLSLSVQSQIALLAAALVLVSITSGAVVVTLYALRSVEEQAGQRAMHVARTVAEITEVKRSPTDARQPLSAAGGKGLSAGACGEAVGQPWP